MLRTNNLNINNGIFQGNWLSPLLFRIALIPVSIELKNKKYGYKIETKKITHLFYMDHLKFYKKNDDDLEIST